MASMVNIIPAEYQRVNIAIVNTFAADVSNSSLTSVAVDSKMFVFWCVFAFIESSCRDVTGNEGGEGRDE